MDSHLADGSILPTAEQVYHINAPSLTALHLYGINKWTSENKYDITIHIHLNDYAGRHKDRVGKYDGFALYVPDPQYSNARASQQIGEAIARRLEAYHATSTLPLEQRGIVPDQQLIAIGSNNSADDASLLIEYGYIYEPQFLYPSTLAVATSDYAYETYLGIQDFFGDSVTPTTGFPPLTTNWSSVDTTVGTASAGVYELQSVLHHLGYYPPPNKNFSDCPVSGLAGDCTRAALTTYQRAHGLEPVGFVGPQTSAALNADLLVKKSL